MAGMPWVKVYTEILDDVKMSRLTDAQKWRFLQLVIMAGECDAGGDLVTGDKRMTHVDVSWRLRCDSQILEIDIQDLIKCGLIKEEKGIISVIKFSERQGPTQEEKRKTWRKRQEAHRNKVRKDIVTSESRMSHALEEEEEEEEEETKNVTPSTAFSHLSALIASKAKLSEFSQSPAKWIKAINAILEINPEECDIDAAIKYMDEKKMSIVGAWSLVNPITIAKSQRERGNGSQPKRRNSALLDAI